METGRATISSVQFAPLRLWGESKTDSDPLMESKVLPENLP